MPPSGCALMTRMSAAAVPSLDFDCGLATASLLAGDVTDEPLIPSDGRLDVRRVVPTEHLLAKHAADDERRTWWLDRLARCYELL